MFHITIIFLTVNQVSYDMRMVRHLSALFHFNFSQLRTLYLIFKLPEIRPRIKSVQCFRLLFD